MESLLDMPLWNSVSRKLKYEKYGEKNIYGDVKYSKAIEIDGLMLKEVSSYVENGKQRAHRGYVSSVLTNYKIQPRDRIEGLVVEDVLERVNFSGDVIAYKGYFKTDQGVNMK